MSKAFAMLLASIMVACSGTTIYEISETTTRWRATTYTLTYTSTHTTWQLSFPPLLSTSTILRTFRGEVTAPLKDQIDVRQEPAPRYSVTALIFDVPLPPGVVKRLESEVKITVQYRSSKSMILEEIGMDDWEKIRRQELFAIIYYPSNITIQEGTGTWSSWNLCFESNATIMHFVFMSKEGLPEVTSVDAFLILKNVATSTSTSLSIATWHTETTVYETMVETHWETKVSYIPIVETAETTPFTTRTQTRTGPSPTVTTRTTVASATSSLPGPSEPSFMLVLVLAFILIVAAAGLVLARKRRKHTGPMARPSPPTLPPPI